MHFNDFIGVQPHAYSDDFCQQAIDRYAHFAAAGLSHHRSAFEDTPRTHKDDTSVLCTGTLQSAMALRAGSDLYRAFNDAFWGQHLPAYVAEHPALAAVAGQVAPAFKLQKTRVGGGYHVWHYENSGRATASRLLAWMIYLNDVDEGGETEFLYQHRRERPRAGTLLIWPAGFTHTHRGNPPLSNEKYIITGWVERSAS